jgi:hypothetical protein
MEKKCSSCLLVILTSFTLVAQVAVRFEPRHKVALENEWVRLLDVRLPPGDTSLFHIHEIPSFFIPLSTTEVGIEVKGQQAQDSKFTIGGTYYNGFENGPLIHRVWNTDTNTLHIIDLELLATKNITLPATIQLPGAKIDFENEKLRVYKFEVAPKQTLRFSFLTPMLLISVSGPTIQTNDMDKKSSSYSMRPGMFQWIEAQKKIQIKNRGPAITNAILILLK